MPVTVQINGRYVTLEDNEVTMLIRRLVAEVRQRVWAPASGLFLSSYGRWEWHFNQRRHPIHWVIEAAGGADLPNASTVRRLKRLHDQLNRQVTPQNIRRFFQDFATWQRDAATFRRNMSRYLNDFEGGGETSVQVLTITRDASFLTLQLCAAISTGGASAGASASAAAAGGAGTALLRAAATGFVINEMRNSATRLGQAMSGRPMTMRDTLNQIGQNALQSTSDAMLGEIVGHFIRPLKDMLSNAAIREVRNGNLVRGVTLELGNDRIVAVVGEAVNELQRQPRRLRPALRDTPRARSADEAARSTSRHLMANRDFRNDLARRLRAEHDLMCVQ